MSEGAMPEQARVWVFTGGGDYPGGVFSTRKRAEAWIGGHGLTGTLTAYPLDAGVYDWMVGRGWFRPKQEYQTTPRFIGGFSSASLEHYHYEDGRRSEETA